MSEMKADFFSLDPGFLAALQARRLQNRRSSTRLLGEHWSRRRGEGFTFADYKEYTIGDDVRFIDWSKSAQSGRWYVRQFETEIQTPTYIILDLSRSMGVPESDCKGRYAAEIALALTYMATIRRDPVTCFVLGGGRGSDLGFSLPCRNVQEFYALAHRLTAPSARPEGLVRFSSALADCLSYFGRRGLAVIISDFLFEPEDLYEPLTRLMQGGHELAAVRVVGPGEQSLTPKRQLVRVLDAETGDYADVQFDPKSYADHMQHHINLFKRWCRHRHVVCAMADTRAPLRDFILMDLAAYGLIR